MTIPKKIIVLVIDTLRADHLGCYGYARGTSPNIDGLAGESILFSHAFTPVSYTLPAIASLMTSRMPESHGIGFSQKSRLSQDSDLTLAELLRDKGYATAAFVSSIVLRKETRLDLGFDVYDDELTKEELNRPDYLLRDGTETIQRALAYIRQNREKDFFVFIHLMDVHGPYVCPPPYDALFVEDRFYGRQESLKVVSDHYPCQGIPAYQVLRAPGARPDAASGIIEDARYYRARYDGGIRKCDEDVASLLSGLKTLGIYGDTLLILTSDHGEALGENGIYFFHGVTVTPEQIRVPLLLKPPVGSAGRPGKISTAVSLLDIVPTILSECEIDWSGLDLHGSSLQELIQKGEDPLLAARSMVCKNECQDATVNPEGTLKLQRSSRPFFGHYAYVPELIDRLDGAHYNWKTGKALSANAAIRRSRIRRLGTVIREEPISFTKIARIAYLLGAIVLSPTLKYMILSLAPWLQTRFGNPDPDSVQDGFSTGCFLLPPDAVEICPPTSFPPEMLADEKLAPGERTDIHPPKSSNDAESANLRSLKVALFVHGFFPRHYFGTETYTLQLADNLRRLGHEPVVVSTAYQGEPRQRWMVTRYRYDGIPVYCIDMNFAPPRRFRDTYYHESLRPVF